MTTGVFVVRFLLEGSHTMDIVMEEREARSYVSKWGDDQLPAGGKIRGTDLEGRAWAVDVSRILCIFTIDPEKLRQQQFEAQAAQEQLRQNRPPAGNRLAGNQVTSG